MGWEGVGWDLVNSVHWVGYGGGAGYSALWFCLASSVFGYCVGGVCYGES